MGTEMPDKTSGHVSVGINPGIDPGIDPTIILLAIKLSEDRNITICFSECRLIGYNSLTLR